MNLLTSLALTVNPIPEDDLKPGLLPEDVTPGVAGFLFTLFVAVAIFLLIRDMVKRIRRVRYRSQMEETAEAEAAASAGDGANPAGPTSAGRNAAGSDAAGQKG